MLPKQWEDRWITWGSQFTSTEMRLKGRPERWYEKKNVCQVPEKEKVRG